MPLSANLCRIVMFANTAKQTVFCGSLLKSRCEQKACKEAYGSDGAIGKPSRWSNVHVQKVHGGCHIRNNNDCVSKMIQHRNM